jgi:hypothetical protein
MPPPNPIPATLSTGQPFPTAAARAAGVSAWQLRGTRYSSPFHGVHQAGSSEGLAAWYSEGHRVPTLCMIIAKKLR